MLRPLGGIAAVPADVMNRLTAAEAKADKAAADALAADGRAEAARVEAVDAKAVGLNARQMVLNDRPKLAEAQTAAEAAASKAAEVDARYDTLEELAASYAQALPASVQDRAELRAWLTTVAAQVASNTSAITALQSAVAALQAAVAALQALKVMVGFGSTTLSGSLLAGASRDVVVPLSRDMTVATYSAGTSLSGGTSLLGQLVHDGIVTQTRTTVTVRVRNVGLTSIANLSAAVVYVVAAREG